MDDYTTILEQSIELYHKLFSIVTEAVENAHDNCLDRLTEKTKKIGILFDEIESTDKKLVTICTEHGAHKNKDLWQEREDIMKQVLDYHGKQIPHLTSILAVKKAELQNIRTGRRGLSGYHTGNKQTGKLITNSY